METCFPYVWSGVCKLRALFLSLALEDVSFFLFFFFCSAQLDVMKSCRPPPRLAEGIVQWHRQPAFTRDKGGGKVAWNRPMRAAHRGKAAPSPPGILKIKHHNPLIVIGEVHWAYHTLHRKWRGVFNNYNFGFSKATVLDGTIDETHDLECTGCFSFLFFLFFFFTFMSETVENEFCRRLVQLSFLFFFFFLHSHEICISQEKKSLNLQVSE